MWYWFWGAALAARSQMTQTLLRLLLFAALFVLAPLPFFLVETGRVPLARMFQLTAYLIGLIVEEGGQGAVIAATWAVGSQALLWAVVVFFVAGAIAAGLLRLGNRRAFVVSAVLIAGALVGTLSMTPYITPFSVVAPVSGLAGVFR